MDDRRRSARHLESRDGYNRAPTADSFRASTADSGFGSASAFERSTTLDSRATNGTLSSLSRDTPTSNDHENTERQEDRDERPGRLIKFYMHFLIILHNNDLLVRINRTSVLGSRCYEQAFVSYIDHPSAFFLQLAHFEKQYTELEEEIK